MNHTDSSILPLRLWQWSAIDCHGQRHQGTSYAAHRADTLAQLSEQHLCPLALRPLPVRKRHWNTRQRIHFIRQLASLLQAGIALTDGLTLLAQQHPIPQWQALASHLASRLRDGTPLTDAMRQWPDVFPPLFIALLHTGELTGKLDHCCQQLADQQQQQYQLQQKVNKALRYPAFTLTLALLITLALCIFVLPEFAAIYQTFNAPLPWLTRSLIALSDFISHHPLTTAITLLTPPLAIAISWRHPSGRQWLQQRISRIPLISPLSHARHLSHLYTLLTLCQQAGLPLSASLSNAIHSQSCPLYRQALTRIQQHISEGTPLWQAISQQPLFTALCRQLIRTGELTGTLDCMLDRLAHWHSEQTRQRADQLVALLEPATLLIIGGLIGVIVLALYLPVFSLGDIISAG